MAQQGWPVPPQAVQELSRQMAVASVHLLFAQQRSPVPPQGTAQTLFGWHFSVAMHWPQSTVPLQPLEIVPQRLPAAAVLPQLMVSGVQGPPSPLWPPEPDVLPPLPPSPLPLPPLPFPSLPPLWGT